MRKLNKIVLIICIYFVLILNIENVYATGTCYIASYVDKNAVAKNDVVIMSVVASGNRYIEMKNINYDINYDSSKFEVLSVTNEKEGWQYNIEESEGRVSCNCFANLDEDIISKQETLIGIAFKAKDEGYSSINIENVELVLRDNSTVNSEKCIQNIKIISNKNEAVEEDTAIEYDGVDVSKYNNSKLSNYIKLIIIFIFAVILIISIVLIIKLLKKWRCKL